MIQTSISRKMPFTEEEWEQSKLIIKSNKWQKRKKDYFNKLKYYTIEKDTLQRMPNFIALDTETYNENGNLICLCNSRDNDSLIRENNSLPNFTIRDYSNYLRKVSRDVPNTVFVFWNLKFDASIILKSLSEEQLKTLDVEGEVTTEDGILVKYLHKKMLSLRDGKMTVKIYDAMQFYLSSLDKAAQKYLGDQKEYTGKYQTKNFPNNIEKDEFDLIVEYCQKDCVLAEQLMVRWVEKFHKGFGFYPQTYFSVGSIAVTYLRTEIENMPEFACAPYKVQKQAYESYFGGRFEIFKRGHLKNISHYDINSAYPYAMVLMPDFRDGEWIEITSLDEYKKKATGLVGFYTIQTIVQEEVLTPFLFRDDAGLINCPSGEFRTTTTGMELDVALKHYDVEITFIRGYAFVPNKKERTKFGQLVSDMYDERLRQTDDLQKTVYKMLINSLYGKFAQSKPEPAGLYSPICCAYITGFCRAQILESAKDNKNDIVMIATDGIFSEKPLKVDTSGKKVLGHWEAEFHPEMYLIMAGVYSTNTEDDPEQKAKSRGFGLTTYNTETGRKDKFNFVDAEVVLNENGDLVMQVTNLRSLSIKHALIQHAKDTKDIGKMTAMVKEIQLNGDKKRIWMTTLNNIKTDYNLSIAERLIRTDD